MLHEGQHHLHLVAADSHRLLDECMKEQMDTRGPVCSLDPVPSLLEILWGLYEHRMETQCFILAFKAFHN